MRVYLVDLKDSKRLLKRFVVIAKDYLDATTAIFRQAQDHVPNFNPTTHKGLIRWVEIDGVLASDGEYDVGTPRKEKK